MIAYFNLQTSSALSQSSYNFIQQATKSNPGLLEAKLVSKTWVWICKTSRMQIISEITISRPKLGSRIKIRVQTLYSNVRRCYYNIISKGVIVKTNSLTFRNNVGFLTFNARFIHAPQTNVIFFIYDKDGSLISSTVTISLETLPNYVS